MIALDTNVLARYLLTDDRKQAKIATALLEGQEQFTAPPTVILELVWVLESCDCARPDVVKGLRLLFGLPNFKPKEPEALYVMQAAAGFTKANHLEPGMIMIFRLVQRKG